MKAGDVKRFFQIIEPIKPVIKAAGFDHYVDKIFRRIVSSHIYQDFLFAWPRNAKDEFNLYLEIRCRGDMLMAVINGRPVNPFFNLNVGHTFCCTENGKRLMDIFDPPPYSFEDPFPYFNWFLNDTRPVWEEWYAKFTTPQSLVDWCFDGGDICGINKYEAPVPISYHKAAMILACMGRNQEALEAMHEYHRLSYENKPGVLEFDLRTNPLRYAYQMQFMQDLKLGKHVIPAEYGPI